MTLTQLENIVAYRMHTPKWAVAPTSGAGAAKHGGRVNRPGVAALYLALETETAIQEYQHLSSLLPPGTLISYKISVDSIIDFRQGYATSTWESYWEDFYCDWRELWFNQHIEPPSWFIGDAVIAIGAKGILFQSQICAGGTNLVLYPDVISSVDSIFVYDPNDSLPKNQKSWV